MRRAAQIARPAACKNDLLSADYQAVRRQKTRGSHVRRQADVWFLYAAGYNMSVAVWVGLIALLGIDAETGVFMLLYLDLAFEEARREGACSSLGELREAIVYGAAKRLRPKFMTFATTCVGLFPIMWATGAGSDVMKRIAAPMVGGIFTSFVLGCWYTRPFTRFGGETWR